MEMDYMYNLKTLGERFQIVCLYLAKLIEKRIMVRALSENLLDILSRKSEICYNRFLTKSSTNTSVAIDN